MTEIGVRELKAHTSEILRRLREEGVRYTLTYRGRAVGVLLPLGDDPADRTRDDETWNELHRLGKRIASGWPAGLSSGDVLSEMRR